MSTTPVSDPVLRVAHCAACGSHTWPPEAYGCRRCGGTALSPVPLPGTPTLLNFVTVHSELAPGLPVPCVIGEVQLAPGLVEEVMVAVADESVLSLGQTLLPQPHTDADGRVHWRFAPLAKEAA